VSGTVYDAADEEHQSISAGLCQHHQTNWIYSQPAAPKRREDGVLPINMDFLTAKFLAFAMGYGSLHSH
jgi:hypothetical protein